jgi:hypothetical protein
MNGDGTLITWTLSRFMFRIGVLGIDRFGLGLHLHCLGPMVAHVIGKVRWESGPWRRKVARGRFGRKVLHREIFVELG